MNKDKQSSFREKAEEILAKFDNGHYSGDQDCANHIIDLVKSIVPEPQEVGEPIHLHEALVVGAHNKCRQEILDKLDSPKEL